MIQLIIDILSRICGHLDLVDRYVVTSGCLLRNRLEILVLLSLSHAFISVVFYRRCAVCTELKPRYAGHATSEELGTVLLVDQLRALRFLVPSLRVGGAARCFTTRWLLLDLRPLFPIAKGLCFASF